MELEIERNWLKLILKCLSCTVHVHVCSLLVVSTSKMYTSVLNLLEVMFIENHNCIETMWRAHVDDPSVCIFLSLFAQYSAFMYFLP